MSRGFALVALIMAGIFAGLGARTATSNQEPARGEAPSATTSSGGLVGAFRSGGTLPRSGVGTAEQLLADLSSVDGPAPQEYRRAEFGRPWEDVDGNGCNQRDDVLVRDAAPGVKVRRQGSCAHDVLAGTWRDPYSGRAITLIDAKDPVQAQQVQIDHIVPLENAFRSGAWRWNDDHRVRYANDLRGLRAVGGRANTAKGARDPSQWLPAIDHCGYVSAWVNIKHRWGLGVTPAERQSIARILVGC